jgi:hypothetical protein
LQFVVASFKGVNGVVEPQGDFDFARMRAQAQRRLKLRDALGEMLQRVVLALWLGIVRDELRRQRRAGRIGRQRMPCTAPGIGKQGQGGAPGLGAAAP